ncbi:MAG: 2-C-methyl-D-erythritol 4-phosphate cytidylyltransferase [Bulleidia sp.]
MNEEEVDMNYSAVIVAAGSGTRMKLGYNKAYYRLDDRTILEHTMDIFLSDPDCCEVVVVTDSETFRKEIPGRIPGRVVLASGGSSREESVSNGLNAVTSEVVFVHDGARPYLSRSCLEAMKQAMETEEAACLMVPCKDTIKVVQNGYIVKTIERSTIQAAQTPQAFRTELLVHCMDLARKEGYQGTDDCSIVEHFSSARIKAVPGSYQNFKITTPEDLKR